MPKLNPNSTRMMTAVERARNKIRAHRYIELLDKHIEGEREMTATQITAALRMINKVVPDIRPMEVKVDQCEMNAKTITNAKLFSLIEGKAERIE